jgi:lipopolysaccharide export LptBFGC system permease protein LptF
MKTLKILNEKEFNKISKNKAVWYDTITKNGVIFNFVVVYLKNTEYYIEIIEKSAKQYVQVPPLVFLEFSALVEEFNEHSKTY